MSLSIQPLDARRRQLLLESSQLRRRFATECGQLQVATSWIETGYSVVQSVRGYWPLIAAGAGFLLTRKRGGALPSLGRIWSVWKMARQALTLWRDFSTAASKEPTAAPAE